MFQISSLPEDFNTDGCPVLEMIDLRLNPICELTHTVSEIKM